MPIALSPALPPPLCPLMFPDVVSFTPIVYTTGARGGAVPSPGAAVVLAAYVETNVAQVMREESASGSTSGVVTDLTTWHIFFADPGTGSPPIVCKTDDVFTWTATQMGVFPTPRILIAKGEASRQGGVWLVEVREQI